MKSLNNLVKDVAGSSPKDEIDAYQEKWKKLDNYVCQEQALHTLFSKRGADFLSQDDLMIKCATLNDFYSTNIFKIYYVVLHYMTVPDLKNRLLNGDLSLVEDLRKVKIQDKNGTEKEMDYYSFATKFCSHHNPTAFPIYDKYVARMLHAFGKVAGFEFDSNDKSDYKKYADAIEAFKKHYGLEDYSLKDIDRFLWILGKELS